MNLNMNGVATLDARTEGKLQNPVGGKVAVLDVGRRMDRKVFSALRKGFVLKPGDKINKFKGKESIQMEGTRNMHGKFEFFGQASVYNKKTGQTRMVSGRFTLKERAPQGLYNVYRVKDSIVNSSRPIPKE